MHGVSTSGLGRPDEDNDTPSVLFVYSAVAVKDFRLALTDS